MNKDEMIKNRILTASKEIVEASGRETLTISSICNKCLISRSTFYKHFSSKEELLGYIENGKSIPSSPINNMRDLILFTAAQLILKRGFDNVSMNDIAKEIGINRTSLYSYFSSITEIAKSIIAVEFEKRKLLEDMARSSNHSPIEKLERLLDYHLNILQSKNNQRLIIDMLNNCYINDDIKRSFDSIEAHSIGHIAAVIEEGKKEKIFLPDIDSKQYATLLYILGYGTAIYGYLHQECDIKNELKLPIMDFLLEALKEK